MKRIVDIPDGEFCSNDWNDKRTYCRFNYMGVCSYYVSPLADWLMIPADNRNTNRYFFKKYRHPDCVKKDGE